MSFPTFDPGNTYEPPPNVCVACFAPGETPHVLQVCLSGIAVGALWVPADPPPPNGTWPLNPVGLCTWQAIIAGYWFDFHINGFENVLQVTDAVPRTYFFSGNPPACTFWHANFFAVPAGNKYYGGHALLQHAMPTDPWSIQEVMDDLGLTPAADLYANPRAITAEQAVHTFSDRQHSTNIKILSFCISFLPLTN